MIMLAFIYSDHDVNTKERQQPIPSVDCSSRVHADGGYRVYSMIIMHEPDPSRIAYPSIPAIRSYVTPVKAGMAKKLTLVLKSPFAANLMTRLVVLSASE